MSSKVGFFECVRVLLEEGCDPRMQDYEVGFQCIGDFRVWGLGYFGGGWRRVAIPGCKAPRWGFSALVILGFGV
jgi:hypothetical protein